MDRSRRWSRIRPALTLVALAAIALALQAGMRWH
jgi:hypothetical protein